MDTKGEAVRKNYSSLLPALISCLGFGAALSLNASAVEPMDPTLDRPSGHDA
jgi:hypothetical protein